jgi:hypothetical protein
MNEVIEQLVKILQVLNGWCQDIPPLKDVKTRFGNPAFADWFDQLQKVLLL